ncbi:hypothetical protein RHSIM_Rhsim02G0155400 [Rhododendron simsii]|uniref:Uncharacterized protein n=1 Tax=Rhododendron simsii TaxID=118357 RepID=A0A834H9S5_RHOSS|nr:hypothetical protein RHSIM_Rhsim02G0155400 [Rhododendron simsii]
MNQPIDLGSLLTIPGAGRGHGVVRSHSGSQGHGRRAHIQTDVPLGFSQEEIEASHRDKPISEDEAVVEEESLDKALNIVVSEQQVVDTDQLFDTSNPGQKEASGGQPEGGTAAEDNTASSVQDLTADE